MKKQHLLLLVAIGAVVLFGGFTYFESKEQKSVAPAAQIVAPPGLAGVDKPVAVEADAEAILKEQNAINAAKTDPLMIAASAARLNQVNAINAGALRDIAVANAEAAGASKKNNDEGALSLPSEFRGNAPITVVPDSVILQDQPKPKKIRKINDSAIDRIKLLMISSPVVLVSIDGNTYEQSISQTIDSITVVKIDTASQTVILRHVKSGRTRTIAISQASARPADIIEPIKKMETSEARKGASQ